MARFLKRRDLTFAVVAVLFAVQAVVRSASHLDPAIAWYLYAGGRLLDGAALYVDIFEVNPPLGLWLSAAVVAVARWTAVDPTFLLKAILLVLTGVSIVVSARLLAAATDVTAATRHFLVILITALLLFLPAAEFGQRDHVAILTITPWVLLRWNRLVDARVPWALAAAVGFGAAFGMWLKPHFFFVLISIEVTMLFGTRNARAVLRVETLTPIVLGIVYVVLIRTSWSATLLTTVALYGSRAFIPIYGVPFEAIVGRLILPFALAAAAVAGTRLLTEQLQLLRTLLFVAGATFVCTYVLQAGQLYQTMPALNFLALAAGLALARTLAGEVRLHGFVEPVVVGGAAAAILAIFVGAWPNQMAPYRGHFFEAAIATEAPQARSILIASTEVADPFPLVNETGLVWASRFPSLWLSPHIASKLDDEGGPADDIGRFALDAMVGDLVAFAPDIVFVDEADERAWYRGRPLDYLDFWDNDPRFLGFWKAYERRGSTGGFGIYVRVAVPSPGSGSAAQRTRSNEHEDDQPKRPECILAEVINTYC